MRVASLSGVLIGTVAVLCATSAQAQSGTPVQVVPITPVTQGQPPAPASANPGPVVITPVNVQPAGQQPQIPAAMPAPVPAQTPYRAAATPAGARKLELAFKDGRVTLTAENVTVSEILAEWTKRGGTVIDNGEKLVGGLVSFAFENEPELNVVQALLRPYPGMIVVPRAMAANATASTFARINIVPRSTATSGSFVGVPATAPQYQNADDELPPIMAPGQMPGARAPQPAPPPPAGPLGQPTAGPGAARPGAVVAPVTPTVPGQIIK